MNIENNSVEKIRESPSEHGSISRNVSTNIETSQIGQNYDNIQMNSSMQMRGQNNQVINIPPTQMEMLRKQYEMQRMPYLYNTNNANMVDASMYGVQNQNQMLQNAFYQKMVNVPRAAEDQGMMYLNNNYLVRMSQPINPNQVVQQEKEQSTGSVLCPTPPPVQQQQIINTNSQVIGKNYGAMQQQQQQQQTRIINQNVQQPHQSPTQLMMSGSGGIGIQQQQQYLHQQQPSYIQIPQSMNPNYIDTNQMTQDNMIYGNNQSVRSSSSNMQNNNQMNSEQNTGVILNKPPAVVSNQYIYNVKNEQTNSTPTNMGNVQQQQQQQEVSSSINNGAQVMIPAQQAGNIGFESLSLPNKINLIGSQITQVQASIASISLNTNQPQSVQLYQFLSEKLSSLKSVYVQLLQLQQIQQQRNVVMPQPPPPACSVTNIPAQFMNNPNAYTFYQQQLAYQNQQMTTQMNMMPLRATNIIGGNSTSSAYPQLRISGSGMSNQPQLMMQPPGLSRFQGNRMGYMNSSGMNQNMMMQQMNLRMMNSYDSINRGRRGGIGSRMQKRRKKYSTESEEEEEMTTSDADSAVSQLSASGTNLEETELRRSTRRHNTKSYTQEYPDESDDEKSKKDQESTITNAQDLIPFQSNDPVEGKIMLIERILSDRTRKAEELDDPTIIVDGEVEEFYVKFKYYSYLHCEWCTSVELKKRDRNALSKIKRYKLKKKESPFLFIDEDPFNPDYIEIDRILDCKVTADPTNPSQNIKCYLVKWCALPYDESTWEFEDCIDDVYIKEYVERNIIPSPEVLQHKTRPNIYQWSKIEQSPIYKNANILRDYQLEGINWLLYEYCCGTNCILADEMGLGKTVQSIAFLIELRRLNMRGPFLVIAPLSTIGNWYREFQSWTDFNVVVFHGAASSRNIIHRYELFYRNDKNEVIENICKFEVLITTYEMILAENDYLKKVVWRVAIVDEAHRLKNRKCKLLENLSTIMIEHRILLTGTPLQNTLEELLSLLNFLDPSRAEALENLMSQNSGKLESNIQVQQIQSFLKPVILRRLKEDVEKNIAPKEETIIEVEMTNIQKKVYRGILERNLSFLTKGSTSSNLPNLMNIMMELRKCCNHPFLINGVEEKIIQEYVSANDDIDRNTAFRRSLIESSGKMVLVDKLLPKLKANGHKMLIFSQMVRVLDLIEEYLLSHSYLFERIDGSVRGNLRQAAIDRFSKVDSDRTVFLLCTKAGGLGINLTAADTVIIFDSDWNPQNDIQAQARCHRIGQNKAVKVYRLICRKTYEREMFDRASLKLGLDRAVLQDINANNNETGKASGVNQSSRAQLSKKEIEELLRRGAYAAVMDEDIDETARFCSEDIDQILERRATVVQIAGEAKGSTFAKASFNANINSEQVDVDDPDFWEKWAKSAKVNPNSATGNNGDFIIDDTPRIRKKIHSLNDDDDEEVNYEELLEQVDIKRRSQRFVTMRTSWNKKECMKVERQLLIYGWGRWNDILNNAGFKSNNITLNDIEQIAKTILVVCWQVVRKNDNSFTDFVEKSVRLIHMKRNTGGGEQDSEDYNYRPYGSGKRSNTRSNSKKIKAKKKGEISKVCLMQVGVDWKNSEIDTLVFDTYYKKHLIQTSSKILIRLRMLFYIEYYILRNCKDDIISGIYVEDIINISIQETNKNNIVLPVWWDEICDRSLVIGIYKHGYEKYDLMKLDKQLCFSKHILGVGMVGEKADENVIKRRGRRKKVSVTTSIVSDEEDRVVAQSNNNDVSQSSIVVGGDTSIMTQSSVVENNEFPANGDLNIYIKRLVTTFWKNRMKALSKSTSTSGGVVNVCKKNEVKNKWTKKEEYEFIRIITTQGLFKDAENNIKWDVFRTNYEFSRKDNNMLNEYYISLIEKCNNVINMHHSTNSINNSENITPTTTNIVDSSLNYEKAIKILSRIQLFNRIRQCIVLPDLNERIKLAPVDNDLPIWWTYEFDIDLLHTISQYGIELNDKKLFLNSDYKFSSIVHQLHQSILSINTQNQYQSQESSTPNMQSLKDIKSINEMSVDLIKSMIHFPKLKSIINRSYGLVTFILNGKYEDFDTCQLSSFINTIQLDVSQKQFQDQS